MKFISLVALANRPSWMVDTNVVAASVILTTVIYEQGRVDACRLKHVSVVTHAEHKQDMLWLCVQAQHLNCLGCHQCFTFCVYHIIYTNPPYITVCPLNCSHTNTRAGSTYTRERSTTQAHTHSTTRTYVYVCRGEFCLCYWQLTVYSDG